YCLAGSPRRSSFFIARSPSEIYALSLHDALPIFLQRVLGPVQFVGEPRHVLLGTLDVREQVLVAGLGVLFAKGLQLVLGGAQLLDRKSTRLNSSHVKISYAVFCLKKKTIRSNPPL